MAIGTAANAGWAMIKLGLYSLSTISLGHNSTHLLHMRSRVNKHMIIIHMGSSPQDLYNTMLTVTTPSMLA